MLRRACVSSPFTRGGCLDPHDGALRLSVACGSRCEARNRRSPADPPPLWMLAVSFGVAEVFVMHIRIARHAQTFSLAEIPLVFGLAFATPGGLVLAQTVGVAIALAVHRRQKPLRLTFNVAQRACTTLLAVVFVAVSLGAARGWPSIWCRSSARPSSPTSSAGC